MSKYSVGDKFVVEITEVMKSDNGTLYRSSFSTLVFDDYGLDRLQKVVSDEESHLELKASYEEGRKAGQEEAIKWCQQNETDMYNAGLNDAWELAKKIMLNELDGGMSAKDFYNIFDKTMADEDVLKKLTAQEALAKLEAYEKEQEEIKVGDVVISRDSGLASKYAVISISEAGLYCGVTEDGTWHVHKNVRKTGKHINIQSILAEIGKE